MAPVKPFFRLTSLCLLLVCSHARAVEIQLFHAEIRAQKDTSLDVLETIRMDFESSERHGIYRIIPVV